MLAALLLEFTTGGQLDSQHTTHSSLSGTQTQSLATVTANRTHTPNHRMKSKASQRFNRLHPDSHRDFQNILQSARKRKECSDGEVTAETDEVRNMIKNKILTKSTQEDQIFSETERLPSSLR